MFRSLVKEKLLEVPRFASVYRKGKFYPVDKEDIDFDYHLVEKWKDETVSMEKVTGWNRVPGCVSCPVAGARSN